MLVLRNHFDGKTTILIHELIINGCQNFTMAEADEVIEKYNVPLDTWQQVLNVYTGVSTEEQIQSFINDEDWRVRLAVAQYGNDEHRDLLVNDVNWWVRLAVAQYGNNEHRDQLVNNEDWRVRKAVAQHGNDKHRDLLVNDEDVEVRKAVAQYDLVKKG